MVFDGVCNFCSAGVLFILKHERNHELRFVAMQSTAGRRVLQACGAENLSADSFLLIDGDAIMTKSNAAIRIAYDLRMPWRLLLIRPL
jgi:predicted DCC family thiol-disulfide oxidoreductase YuxK